MVKKIKNYLLKKKFKFFHLLVIYYFLFLLNSNIINFSKKPKISVFLPIYNKEQFLNRSIYSIQAQILKEIEIIAVNDCSTDNSIKILKQLSKRDKRIKIINNDRNHGLLYSRSMGILNSTGEYVMNLDPDDILAENNNLNILYYSAKKHNVELILFLLEKIESNLINITSLNNYFKLKNINQKTRPFIPNYLITNKLVRRNLLLKALQFFKEKIYGNKWNFHEDNIWSLLITRYAKSKKIIYKYCYIYLVNRNSLMNNRGNILEFKNLLYRYEMIEKINEKKSLDNLRYLIIKILKIMLHKKYVNKNYKKKIIVKIKDFFL